MIFKRRVIFALSLVLIAIFLVSCNQASSNKAEVKTKSESSKVSSIDQKADDFQSEEFINNFINIYAKLSNNKDFDFSYLNTFINENTDIYEKVKSSIEQNRKNSSMIEVKDVNINSSNKNSSDLEVKVTVKMDVTDKANKKSTIEKKVDFKISNDKGSYKIKTMEGELN